VTLAPFPATGTVSVTGHVTFTQDTAAFISAQVTVLDASNLTQSVPLNLIQTYETAYVAHSIPFSYNGPIVKGGALTTTIAMLGQGNVSTCSLDTSGTYSSVIYDISK
jgi:hypothetical protein